MRQAVINGTQSNFYYVCELGNIYSIKKDGSFRKLTPYITHDGYRRIQLAADVERKHYRVNRIVAETYIENREGLPIVHHINSVRNDDRVVNLMWTDNSYNQKERFKNSYSSDNTPVLQINKNTGEVVGCYLSMKFAGMLTGIAPQNISKVCRKLRNHAGGYKWEYAIRV